MKKIVSKMAIVILSLLIVISCIGCKKDSDKNSSESVSSVSVDTSSVDTVSTDTVYSETSSVSSTVSETTSSQPVSSTSTSTTSVASKPSINTSSKTSNNTSQAPVVSQEPVVTQPVVSQETTSVSAQTNTWVCPNPAEHGNFDDTGCHSASDHQAFILEYQAEQAELAKIQQKVYPEGYNQFTWCHVCDRPLGDGYNGTCLSIFENGRWTCHHYDTGETCQIHH